MRQELCIPTVGSNLNIKRAIFLLTHSGSTSGQPKVLETLNADPNWSSPTNERQRQRLEVLQWKSADCNGVQLDPKSARPPPSPFATP